MVDLVVLTFELDDFLCPELPEKLYLFRVSLSAVSEFLVLRFVFNMVPADTYS